MHAVRRLPRRFGIIVTSPVRHLEDEQPPPGTGVAGGAGGAGGAGVPAPAEDVDRLTDHTDVRHVDALSAGLSGRQRIAMLFWRVLGQPIFRLTFHNWYGIRRALLRLFGARLHPTTRIRPTASISHPWNLTIGAHTAVGDYAILFSLGKITIGRRCTISQYAHLCAGGHDYTRRSMTLLTDPINIGDDVWVAADVFVGAGVTIGDDTVIGARSTVMRSLPPRSICAGDDAHRLAERVVRYPAPQRPGQPPPETF